MRSGRKSYSYMVGTGTVLWMSVNVMAFLDPSATKVLHVYHSFNTFVPIQFHAAERNKNAEVPEDGGLSAFFESRKKKQEDVIRAESELSAEGTGFLKSFSRWREGRKQKGKDDLIEEEQAEQWGRKGNCWKNVDTRQMKDANNGAAVERERIRRNQPGIKTEESSSGSIISSGDESEWSLKRFNPVSAAQKLLSAVSNKQKSKEEWIVVASKTSIAPGALVPISAAGLDLLLVASKDGSALHCVANSCPHLGTPLEIGTLERRPVEYSDYDAGNSDETPSNVQENYLAKLLTQDGCEDCIICPLHKTAFALESGEVRGVSLCVFYVPTKHFRSGKSSLTGYIRNGVHIPQ